MKQDDKVRWGVSLSAAIFLGVFFAVTESPRAQCPAEGDCPNQVIPRDPTNPYQQDIHSGVRNVLLYDNAWAYHAGKHALRRSMSRLAEQYGFRLEIIDEPFPFPPEKLEGVDIVVFSQGQRDVLDGLYSESTNAMERYIYEQGGALLMISAAGTFIPCPDHDLGRPDCRFLARAVARQYRSSHSLSHRITIYVDSVRAGDVPPHASLGAPDNIFDPPPPPAEISHGIMNPETRSIFTGLPRVWEGMRDIWYPYFSNPRLVEAMVRPVVFDWNRIPYMSGDTGTIVVDGNGRVFTVTPREVRDHVEGHVNVLLSLDEMSNNVGTHRMGDHPVAWTRKMGNGLAAFNTLGHTHIPYGPRVINMRAVPYDTVVHVEDGDTTQVFVFTTAVGDTLPNDSLLERFNWRLMRYLARDFVGCMDSASPYYNPEASVERLTESDHEEPCSEAVNVRALSGGLSPGFVSVAQHAGALRLTFAKPGLHVVHVADVRGRTVFAATVDGLAPLEITGLRKGLHVVRVIAPGGRKAAQRVLVD